MDKSTEILNELKEISPTLAAMERVNVFQVPDDYFTELDKRIFTSVFLHQDEKNKDQQVPEGYFEALSSKIMLKIKSAEIDNPDEEIQSISPLLFSLKNTQVLSVPFGYFDSLSDNIKSQLNDNKAKVISINTGRKWWKYAAAAVIAGGITFGSLQIFKNQNAPDSTNQMIAAAANMPDYIKRSLQYDTPEQLDKGIASLSDNEIADYLENHGSIMDDDLITKDIDTTGLPDTDDYLINDSTLNDFLNTIDDNSSNQNTQ